MVRILKCLIFCFFVSGCVSIKPPEDFEYVEIKTPSYTLASWQKITNLSAPVRIYIEGDGHAFNMDGYPTSDPTPKGVFLRKIAFSDPNPNVVYLARPCQYIMSKTCREQDWTTGRFSKKIIESEAQAVQKIASHRPVVLIGHSGGAMVSGLIVRDYPQIEVKKWITIAGLLDHESWTSYLHLLPLEGSLNLKNLPNVKQIHFAGTKDQVIPIKLSEQACGKENLVIVKGASHSSGYEKIYPMIYQ